jgi:hypothetical protein
MQKTIFFTAFVAALAAADNCDGYNANMNVKWYTDCYNQFLNQLAVNGIPLNGNYDWTCPAANGNPSVQFWNDQYQGYLWDGNPVDASVHSSDQMIRDINTKNTHCDFFVFGGATSAFRRGVGYRTL